MVAISRLILFYLLLASFAWRGASAGEPPAQKERNAPASAPTLTAKERAYLAHKGSIKYCVQPDWLPFQRINEQGEHEGIAQDMLQLMAERLDMKFELLPTKDWAESVAAIRARRCDILPLGMDVPSRHDLLNFSRPYVSEPLAVATRASEPDLHRAEDIGNRKLGLIKGFAPKKILQQLYPFMNIVDVESTLDGLRKVQTGENFGYIDNVLSLSYTARKLGMQDLKISYTLNFTHDLGFVSRNDEPLLGSIMQKASDSISYKENRAIVSRWVSVKLEPSFDYSLFWKIGTAVVLILVGVIAWNRRLASLNRKLAQAYAELDRLAVTDTLTGLSNRLRLDAAMAQEWARCERQQGCFSLILLDIDKFKNVNDTYGHLVGDTVLIEVARVLTSNMRKIDVLGRWGGEEFLIMCPNTGSEAAVVVAEKLRVALAAHDIAVAGAQTASFGITTYRTGDTIREMMIRVDAAMYIAKETGRNRFVTG
jgi:polar amino acid transport system substrate-binding protein